jgi:hypothetical protein
MKDYLKQYGKNNKVSKHQEGGTMPPAGAEAGAPAASAPAGGGQDINSALMQAYQAQDPTLALQVVNMIVEAMQAQGGGGEAGGVPAAKNGMRLPRPIFRKGGTLKV